MPRGSAQQRPCAQSRAATAARMASCSLVSFARTVAEKDLGGQRKTNLAPSAEGRPSVARCGHVRGHAFVFKATTLILIGAQLTPTCTFQ